VASGAENLRRIVQRYASSASSHKTSPDRYRSSSQTKRASAARDKYRSAAAKFRRDVTRKAIESIFGGH
jgi:hypothetical protein